ncbi:hypothetical protein ACYSNX_07140 [Myroides sp. LJL115]
MKKRLLSVALLMGTSFVAQAQVGIGTATPNKSAELSVVANNRGLLIPNVALSDIKDAKTISNGNVESLLVFNTNGVPSRDVVLSVTPGYYYWHIDRWHRMTSEADIPEIVVNQFQDILNLDGDKVKNIIQGLFSETLTVVEYDPATGALKYIDEKGQPTVIDIAGAVKNFETVTKIDGNKEDGTFTFIDEAGNSTTLNIADYVKSHETLTTLVKQRPGLYTYTNEHGKTQDITVVSDLIQVIENKTDLDLYNVLKQLVKVEQSLTQLVYNATTNKLTYIDESSKENELDIDTLVKTNQNDVKVIAGTNITVTEDSSKKNLVTYTLDVPNATKNTPGVVKPGTGLNVDEDGSLNVDILDVKGDLANGTILSSSINVLVDKGSVLPTLSDVTLEIAAGKEGQVLTSVENADGSTTTVWKDSPLATEDTPGVVKPGAGLNVDIDGSLNVDLSTAKNAKDLTAVGAAGAERITITNGLGTTLKNTILDVNEANLKLQSIGGKLEVNQITPGKDGQVLVSKKDDSNNVITKWEDASGTTNTLELGKTEGEDNYNKITSTVNGVDSIVDLNGAVNSGMLQNNSVTAGKVDASVAGNGLVKNKDTGALDVDFPTVKGELAKGKVSSSTITVNNGTDNKENTTFADVTLEITPAQNAGQILTTTIENGKTLVEWKDVPGASIATENTPGVVKPGAGLNVDKEGSLNINYSTVKGELAKGKISSTSITVVNANKEKPENTTFADVTLEITPGTEGQILSSKKVGDNTVVGWIDAPSLNLDGDVTLDKAGETVVGGIQNTPVAPTPPTKDGQVLVYDETSKSWIPGNTNVDHLAGAKNLTGAVDTEGATPRITVVGGEGTTLKGTTLDVNEKALNLSKIGGILNVNQIKPGNKGQILTTTEVEGNKVIQWEAAPEGLTLAGDVTLDTDGKTVVGGIQNTPVSPTPPSKDGQALVYEEGKDGKPGQWVPGMPDVNVENILNAKNLTTDGKISIGTATPAIDGDSARMKQGAVLVDTHLSIAKGSITGDEIQDDTITPDDIKGGTDLKDQVLGTDKDGNPEWMDKSTLMVEPWFVQKGEAAGEDGETVATGGDKATLNTQAIYQMGAVAINKETGMAGADLDVAGAIRGAYARGTEEGFDGISYPVGPGSVALISSSVASEFGSVAIGNYAMSTGMYGIAIGQNVKANADASIVIGDASQTDATYSFAFGNDIKTRAFESMALGYGTISTTQRETVMGAYNAILNGNSSLSDEKKGEFEDPNAIHFQIGNGTGGRTSDKVAGNASTAFAMLKNGNTGIGIVGLTDEAAKPTATLDVGAGKPVGSNNKTLTGNKGDVRFRALPTFEGKASDRIVVVDDKGYLKTVDAVAQAKAAMPKVFYMPAVTFDTTNDATGLKMDLHAEYIKQFGGASGSFVSSEAGDTARELDIIPTFEKGDLKYYVTYYDKSVFKITGITKEGVMTYDIIGRGTAASYINIVFVVRD